MSDRPAGQSEGEREAMDAAIIAARPTVGALSDPERVWMAAREFYAATGEALKEALDIIDEFERAFKMAEHQQHQQPERDEVRALLGRIQSKAFIADETASDWTNLRDRLYAIYAMAGRGQQDLESRARTDRNEALHA